MLKRTCKKVSMGIVGLLVITIFSVGCIESEKTVEQKGTAEQTSLMKRARSAVPTPNTNNFLTRKAVAKWMLRMDQPQKEFYNYLVAPTGGILYYFVSQERMVPTASFLTPTQKWWKYPGTRTSASDLLGPAPALDGVYYGNGPKSLFGFNAATDCYFEVVDLGGYLMIITDQPLELEVPELKVSVKNKPPEVLKAH